MQGEGEQEAIAMSFVVQGQPYRLGDVREFENQYGPQRSISFRLSHPEIEVKEGKTYEEAFEAGNGHIERIQQAAADQEVLTLVVRPIKVPGAKNEDGTTKPDWYKYAVSRVIE